MPKTICSLLFLVLVIFLHSLGKVQGQPQNTISPIDLSALQQIKNSLTDIPSSSRTSPSTRFFSSWDFSSHDPCSTFAGITCSSPFVNPRRVTSLILGTGLSDSLGLAGSLSPSISNLSELNQLVLNPGIVTGPIPSQLGNLRKLRVISLTNNRLTGSIPVSIFALPELHTLDLSNNQLWGSIPPSIISHLDQLRVLVLASNRLSGEIPNALPTQLLHLDLKNNLFSGTLPTKLPLSLRYLSVSGNRLWGPLNGLDSLSELVYLDISMNRLSGTIPASLFRSSLSSMLLQRNNLSGVVPQQNTTPSSPTSSSSSTSSSSESLDSSYGEGSIVDLSHNMLTGELPAGSFSGVETLFLNNNRFTGKVPKEYVQSLYDGGTKTLYLQHNYLTDFPMVSSMKLPDSVSLCLSYNCMVPPVGLSACPASAGEQLARPAYQCSKFNAGGSTG